MNNNEIKSENKKELIALGVLEVPVSQNQNEVVNNEQVNDFNIILSIILRIIKYIGVFIILLMIISYLFYMIKR